MGRCCHILLLGVLSLATRAFLMWWSMLLCNANALMVRKGCVRLGQTAKLTYPRSVLEALLALLGPGMTSHNS